VLFLAIWRDLVICSSAQNNNETENFAFINRVLQLIEKLYLKELNKINNALQK